jgi:hypothetical protein
MEIASTYGRIDGSNLTLVVLFGVKYQKTHLSTK